MNYTATSLTCLALLVFALEALRPGFALQASSPLFILLVAIFAQILRSKAPHRWEIVLMAASAAILAAALFIYFWRR